MEAGLGSSRTGTSSALGAAPGMEESNRTMDNNGDSIAAIILCRNGYEKTIQCLESLYALADPPDRILVWDNASEDETAELLLKRFPHILLHRHGTNLGVASGRNAAAQLAIDTFAPSHLLFLDNDVIVMPRLTQALLAPFRTTDKRLAQTSAKTKMMRDPSRLDAVGGCRVQFWRGQTRTVGYGEIDRGQYDQPKPCIASGCANLIRTDVFQKLGGFDPVFDPYGPEDLDFSLRARKAGYYSLYIPDAVALHERSQTFENKQYTETYLKSKTRSWFIFMHRHASPLELLVFYLIGAPLTFARMVVRESKKRNLTALKGLIRAVAKRN